MVLRMEQFQQEWAEYMDWLHPPPIQPSPPSFVAETPSPPLLSITQPQLSTPPPSPSPDLQPPLAAAPPAQLAKIHTPLSTEETQPLPAVLPPLSAVQPSRPPPLSVQEPSQSSWVVGLPSPTTLQPLPPLLSTGPPLKSPPSGSAVGFPPKEKGVEAAALAAHQTLIFPRWAQQRGGVTPAQEMRLEALKPKPESTFVLYPMEKTVWAQEMKIKPTFYKMQVLLKDRVGIG